jgi:HNH endonuclease
MLERAAVPLHVAALVRGWALRGLSGWGAIVTPPPIMPRIAKQGAALQKLLAMASNTDQPNACWEWRGGFQRGGYGACRVDGRTRGAHRVSYECANGVVLRRDEFVCHRCDNPKCINPCHLFVGTHTDNMADMVRKGRQCIGEARSRSMRGINPGEARPNAKLTAAKVQELRRLRLDGWEYQQLADRYGVSVSAVFLANAKVNWAHVQ